jgi:hypothetical protein
MCAKYIVLSCPLHTLELPFKNKLAITVADRSWAVISERFHSPVQLQRTFRNNAIIQERVHGHSECFGNIRKSIEAAAIRSLSSGQRLPIIRMSQRRYLLPPPPDSSPSRPGEAFYPPYFRVTHSVFPSVPDPSPIGVIIAPLQLSQVPSVDHVGHYVIRCLNCYAYLSPYCELYPPDPIARCAVCGNQITLSKTIDTRSAVEFSSPFTISLNTQQRLSGARSRQNLVTKSGLL